MSGRYHGSGERINLERDFPQIEDVHGMLEINPSFGSPQTNVTAFSKTNLPDGYISCESPVCNDGGVSLGDILRYKLTDMIRYKKEKDSVFKFRRGYEKMGRGQSRDCRWLYARIEIQIKYRDLGKEAGE